jgi:4a-hydroxytetrahydrobiopterin dehydratase
MSVLKDEIIKEKLKNLSGWNYENNSIRKEFTLKDFSDAVVLVVKIGFEAEKKDHHPDLLLHGWNKVTVTLSTHSEGGVTEKDINLAHQINKLEK